MERNAIEIIQTSVLIVHLLFLSYNVIYGRIYQINMMELNFYMGNTNTSGKKVYNKYEDLFRWACHKLRLQEKFEKNNQLKNFCPRGAIYTCYMGVNIGHEKSRLEARPCVIVSSDEINRKSSNVIIIPLSKEIKYKKGSNSQLAYEWHYVLKKSKYNKLNYDSAVQCEDIRCVSKTRLGQFVCKIDATDLVEIRKRLKKTLQL